MYSCSCIIVYQYYREKKFSLGLAARILRGKEGGVLTTATLKNKITCPALMLAKVHCAAPVCYARKIAKLRNEPGGNPEKMHPAC